MCLCHVMIMLSMSEGMNGGIELWNGFGAPAREKMSRKTKTVPRRRSECAIVYFVFAVNFPPKLEFGACPSGFVFIFVLRQPLFIRK